MGICNECKEVKKKVCVWVEKVNERWFSTSVMSTGFSFVSRTKEQRSEGGQTQA